MPCSLATVPNKAWVEAATVTTTPTLNRFGAELLDGSSFPGLAETKLEISHHVAYYNVERRHSTLSYRAPNHFEIHLQTTSQLCPA